MSSANKLNMLLSGVGAMLICHFLKDRIDDTVIFLAFAFLMTAIFQYLTSRDVEIALRHRRPPIQGWSRFRCLRLSLRLASIDLLNFPNLPDTPNPVLEAVDDAGLIYLAKAQYSILAMGLLLEGFFLLLQT